MTTPSPINKAKPKRRSRGPTDSPRTSKQGHHWVSLTFAPGSLVPSHKVNAYQQGGPVPGGAGPLPGGAIVTEGGKSRLYAHWTPLEKLETNEYLPLRTDSILLHPDTMKACGCVIAAPLVIRGRRNGGQGRERGYVCGKVWPLQSLPLDVAGLGWSAVSGCGISEGDSVEVWPMTSPISQVPTAGRITLTQSQQLNFPVDTSFTNYLLHMHDGCLVTPHSHLAVQYLGEKRVFKVLDVSSVSPDGHTPTHPQAEGGESEIQQKMSNLSINGSGMLEEKEEEEEQDGDSSTSDLEVFKVTSRTRLVIAAENTGRCGRTSRQSGPSFSDVGGLKRQVEQLKELVLHPLKSVNKTGVFFPSGVILHGPPGVGKSLLAKALVRETSTYFIHLTATQVLTQDPESVLQKAFAKAKENSPSLLVVEDLATLCPSSDVTTPGELERRASGCLAAELDQLQGQPQPPGHVTVLATTNQLDMVGAHLRCQGRFEKEIEIPVPSANDRFEILGILLRERFHLLTQVQLRSVAERAHGFVGADLFSLCSEAQYKALHRSLEGGGRGEEVRIAFEDMFSALKEVRPSAMKEVTLEVPKVLWSDIGGQEDVKQSLKEAVERPITHPEVYVRMGIRPPRGVLLYGPPGCSKTMVARALATESGLNFMAVKGPELFSKWVGDSERAVRQVFTRARAAAPAIVFFDEIDALAVQRKNEGSSVADRVLAQLLTEMDGVESLGNVLVVAATNRPDMIDKALIRPGRIDELIYVPLPSKLTRGEIFKIQFKKIPVDKEVSERVEELVTRTKGFSGAEVVSLCQKAALCALRADVDSPCVGWRHFQQALGSIFPQTSAETIKYYEDFKKKQRNVFNHEQ